MHVLSKVDIPKFKDYLMMTMMLAESVMLVELAVAAREERLWESFFDFVSDAGRRDGRHASMYESLAILRSKCDLQAITQPAVPV